MYYILGKCVYGLLPALIIVHVHNTKLLNEKHRHQ